MVHAIKWIFIFTLNILMIVVAIYCLFLSIVYWDKRYMDAPDKTIDFIRNLLDKKPQEQ